MLFRAKAYKSNVDELSDEETLRLVKNRLNALTYLDANLLDIEKLTEKYEIDRGVLLNDYFGFDRDDLSEEAAFVAKLDTVRDELLRMNKLVNLKPEESAAADPTEFTLVPRALIAIKLSVPLFYVNKLNEYLKLMSELQSEVGELDSESNSLYSSLFKLGKVFFENSNDNEKLHAVLKENSLACLMKKQETEEEMKI